MKAPFPYFGGKASIAGQVWLRLGDCPNYVEPFCGTCAVLLARPHEAKYETVNDVNGFVANFWRALGKDPYAVFRHCDHPVNETDLHVWERWLVYNARKMDLANRLADDPHWYSATMAGRWVWGQCASISGNWGSEKSARPHISRPPAGVHRLLLRDEPIIERRPHLSRPPAGVHRMSLRDEPIIERRPHLSSTMGVHRMSLRDEVAVSEEIPRLGRGGDGVHRPYLHRPRGIDNATIRSQGLLEYLQALGRRMRRVRVCCGDWKRVVTPAVTISPASPCAVFLDPPYSTEAGRDMRIYGEHDCGDVAHEVREWAIENGDSRDLRIALCGYEGEHVMPDSWECLEWKANGGMSNTGRNQNGQENKKRERIWFSPHCLKVDAPKQQLLAL